MKVSNADEIREYALQNFILPARLRGDRTVRIEAKSIHEGLGYKNRYPNVCSSIDSQKFKELANVIEVGRSDVKQSSTVWWEFELV